MPNLSDLPKATVQVAKSAYKAAQKELDPPKKSEDGTTEKNSSFERFGKSLEVLSTGVKTLETVFEDREAGKTAVVAAVACAAAVVAVGAAALAVGACAVAAGTAAGE